MKTFNRLYEFGNDLKQAHFFRTNLLLPMSGPVDLDRDPREDLWT